MHEHYETVPRERMEPFIRFADRADWTLRQRRDFPVYRRTLSEIADGEMTVRQTIRVLTAVVRRDEADQVEIEQPDRQWNQEFRSEEWTGGRSLPERKALVTMHEQIPPRVTSEFINHFWLDQDGNNLVDDVTGDPVVKKTVDDRGETVYIDGRYLFDFLRDRGYCLLVGYFQGRQVQDPPHMSIDDGSREGSERGGTFRLSWVCRDEGGEHRFWDGNYWWVSVIDPDDYDLGKQREEERVQETTTFTDIDGQRFTASEANQQENALRSVFFEEELLDPYRRRDETTVEQQTAQGGYLNWKHYYGVRFYRNDRNELYITAKDLQLIPASELRTWADHNIVPEGGLPEEAWKNYFEAEWVDSVAPHRAVVEAFEGLRDRLNEEFDGQYIAEDATFPLEALQRPAVAGEDAFLDVVNEFHKTFIETVSPNAVASLLRTRLDQEKWAEVGDGDGIQGSKQALYELVRCFEDEDVAGTVIQPFNAIYDFRTYEGHRGTRDKKQRALRELGFEEEPNDYRTVYDELVHLLTQRLADLNRHVESWK
jgi:hypothetical protein